MKNLILILFLFSTYTANTQEITYSPLSTCPYELGEITEVKLPEEGFNHPKLSPDGTKMLVCKKGYNGIYVVDLKNKMEVKKLSDGEWDGFDMRWVGNNDDIAFTRITSINGIQIKREYIRKSVTLKSASVYDYSDFKQPSASLKNLKDDIILEDDLKSRKLIANNGYKVWDVATDIGICLGIVLSPDKSKVAFSSYGSEYVYDTYGSGVIAKLNAGLSMNWSPDGQYLLYFSDEESDGDAITVSDLFMCKADGSEYWRLTSTPDILEMYPHWSADGSKLTYMDEATGQIYIVNIKKRVK